METKEFVYELPKPLIASYPDKERSRSRLLVAERETGKLVHTEFSVLGEFLRSGDLLVLNNTSVLPARLRGKRESGGKAEVLLIEPFPKFENHWMALVDSAKRPHVGSRITFRDGVWAEVIGDLGRGRYGLKFHPTEDFMAILSNLGEPPLPRYIERGREVESVDWERYQTVYAEDPGSIAAPTAGFHFTRELMQALEEQGVEIAFVTLHVGIGTFQPVREEVVENHRMDGERYAVSPATATRIERAKQEGRRIIAVGSTTTRALEWIAQKKGHIEEDEGIARLFIYPGYRFQVVDGLITNFHLPSSTPLILVAAFAGLDIVRRAYEEAIRQKYRFYSYGDAMLIL